MQEIIEKALIEYREIVQKADETFAKVQEQYPQEVTCHEGCISCCHSPFDLSLIEAIALQDAFKKNIPYGSFRSTIANHATEAERKLVREKKRFHKLSQSGHTQASILEEASKLEIRCPLLGPDDACILYENRPITCRLYGIPEVINGKVHVCSFSAFKENTAYPTVYLSRFQDMLSALSHKLQKELNSKYKELYKVYIPLSSAILHPIDRTWLGITTSAPSTPKTTKRII